MTTHGTVTLLVFVGVLLGLAWPLGSFIADVMEGKPGWMGRLLGPIERLFYRAAGVRSEDEQTPRQYALAALVFNVLGLLVVYGLQRLQASLPLNPDGMAAVSPEVSFNTAVSFASNTNWQAYGGESTMSYLTQMAALAVQNFLSAATGIAVMVALVRGFTRAESRTLGSFWVDLTRTTLYVLVPLSFVFALFLVSQGVVQTFDGHATAQLVEPLTLQDGTTVTDQLISMGPAASQIAIKQLGTNGGGFFNANSAHPLENPTALSNFFELVAILLVPAALCFTFGKMVRDRRQGNTLIIAMLAIFVPLAVVCIASEQAGNPALRSLGVDQLASAFSSGGNMEGKEVRFGIADSGLWATATTAASNGSVNAMHDSFTPLGGMVPMVLMQLGEVVFGGVGCGLYGILMFAVVAVFIAGLMVGRTPEYLGKKIEAYEMKMASLVVLFPCAAVLVGTAIACISKSGTEGVLTNAGAHGFSEILYALSSGSNNNGSAFGGLTASGQFYSILIGLCMLIGRYWILIAIIALAGALARKKRIPISPGTLPTHTPLFVALLVGTILIVGALTFIPALALGPIVEHLELHG
ncbi:MAG: potassium-transporting ATPase subunit KdpA [Polyangiaceae bacterium]